MFYNILIERSEKNKIYPTKATTGKTVLNLVK